MGREKVVGVIGGMGPEATVEFMRRLIAAVPAKDDEDHLHVIADNNPKVPSRIRSLIEGVGEDPAPVLIAMAQGLETAGADFLTIPCNTAHYYLQQIAAAVRIPVLDVVALTIARLQDLSVGRIGILGSTAVRLLGLFARRLNAARIGSVFPGEKAQTQLMDIIRAVKAARATAGDVETYNAIAKTLTDQGADALLVACTELSLLPKPPVQVPVLDTLDVLVDATVAEARG